MSPGKDRNSKVQALFALGTRLHDTGFRSLIIGRDEIGRPENENVDDVLIASGKMPSKGLTFDRNACVFIDGEPQPGIAWDHYRVRDVDVVELWASAKPVTLKARWPKGAPCSNTRND